MSVAMERAFELRTVFGIEDFASEVDLDAVLLVLQGRPVMATGRVLGPLPEVIVDGRAYLARGLARFWDRWLKAEMIAHYVLHEGDQTTLPIAVVALQERQAHEFAGWLIFGDVYERWGGGVFPVTYALVAEYARVPVECVERWWAIVGGGTAVVPAWNYA